jgi:hypothetical protein
MIIIAAQQQQQQQQQQPPQKVQIRCAGSGRTVGTSPTKVQASGLDEAFRPQCGEECGEPSIRFHVYYPGRVPAGGARVAIQCLETHVTYQKVADQWGYVTFSGLEPSSRYMWQVVYGGPVLDGNSTTKECGELEVEVPLP